ncbi:hypothetical protein IAG41_22500 [Sphingomonas sp. JC676]|uniref:hypothetical protein n=1 Tax=Sphingomonas sp. JC676 TaxID=2768065 RepID=UPI0016580751|nr:hypothetical protein [Sphingomonas sp. JC676]MBC9035170.1 hypothetical protein [Sphingomonas sp. JC676]
MGREYFIVCALPHSLQAEARFHVTLFLSPTIKSDGDSRLGDWRLFPEWGDVAAESLRIELFDQQGTIACDRILDVVDPRLWIHMFPASTPVRPSGIPDWSARKWRSFSARTVHDIARSLHMATILADPANPPDPRDHPLAEPLERLIATERFYHQEGGLRAGRRIYDETLATKAFDAIVESRESLGAIEARIADEGDPLKRIALELHRCRRFYERPEAELPYRANPIPGTPPPPLPENEAEFHTRCGLLGDQPALLHRLGLVIDLKVADPDRMRLSRWLSARVAVGQDESFCRTTRVLCHAAGDAFTSVPRTTDWTDGALRLGDTDRFAVLNLDADGSAIKADRFLWTLPRLLAVQENGDPVNAATPAQRSPGLTVTGTRQAIRIQGDLERQAGLAHEIDAGHVPELNTEDIARGLRVEVWDDHSRRWASLHKRLSHASVKGYGEVYDDLAEQGFIQGTAAHENVRTEDSPVHVHEALFGWEGWSLSAPRPGKRVRHEDGEEVVEDTPLDAPPATPHPFEIRTRVRPDTLPRLRYGRAYSFRAWAVDLAGNSRPHDLNPPSLALGDLPPDLGPASSHADPANFARQSLLGAARNAVARRTLREAGTPATGSVDPAETESQEIDPAVVARIRQHRSSTMTASASFAVADRSTRISASIAHALASTDTSHLTLGPEQRLTEVPRLIGSHLPALVPGGGGDGASLRKALQTVTLPQPFLRWEPVSSPAIVPRRRYTEAESLRVLVIRSGVTQDPDTLAISIRAPADYAQDAEAIAPDCGYGATCERHFAPPKISQMQAELHGMFDIGIGSPSASDQRKMLGCALRSNGTFNDLEIADIDNPPAMIPQPGVSIVQVNLPSEEPKTLPLNPGDPPAPGQLVIHDVDQLALPYLPDPMARGVAISFPEAGRDRGLSFPYGTEGFTADYGGTWPEIEPYRFVLEGGEGLSGSVAGSVITMHLSAGDTQVMRVASAIPRDKLDLLGAWRSLPNAVRNDPDAAEAAADGAIWGLSPFEQVTLVHAVNRPIEMPRPIRVIPIRTEGATSAILAGAVDLHGPSTGTLTAEARWSEIVDDLTLPGVQERQGSATAFQTTIGMREDIAILGAADAEVTLPDLGALKVHRAVHEFGDTRHRMVEYRFRASTRFREYFRLDLLKGEAGIPPGDKPVDDGQSVVGPKVVISVPSSARPAPPIVHSVLPLFRWTDETEPEQPMGRRRTRRAGVRLYLDRPWFSSGDGELLGILLANGGDDTAYPPMEDASGFPFVSKWGADPIWEAGEVQQRALPVLRLDDLLHEAGLDDRERPARPVAMARQLPLAAVAGRPVVTVLGYRPQFNQERGLWFVDVALDPGVQFWPFLRLAVCRYQPDSIAGCHLSQPVQCDFVQLPPERMASVSRTDDRHVRVVVSGPVGHRGEGDASSAEMTALAAAIGSNRRVIARVQRRDPLIPTDLGWRTISVTRLALRGQQLDGRVASWVGELDAGEAVPLVKPGSIESDWRVAIEEWELIEADPLFNAVRGHQRVATRMERRLVYADNVMI